MIRGKKIILPFLISIACFAAIDSLAQRRPPAVGLDQYRAINWTMEDGLPWNGSNVMLKDVKGFLWAGSLGGGLARFDGASFKKYLPDQHKRGAINSDVIFSFVEDSLNNIWIGTKNGLSRYDMKADTFTNFVTTVASFNSDRSVIPFWTTNSHVYCLEYLSRNIVAYNIYSFEKKILFNPPVPDSLSIGGVVINSIILDTTSNCLWMLDQDPDHPGRGVLLELSLDDGKKKQYGWSCNGNTTHRHSFEAMRLDPNRNSLWINSGDGLLEFSLDDKQFHYVDAFHDLIKLSDYDRYVGIDIDTKGRIWLATKPKGILIYDPETQDVQPVFSDPELQQGTGQDNFQIYCDRDGIVWTSDYVDNGIYELLPYNPPVMRYVANSKVQNSLSNNAILTAVPAANGKMWIGTTDGLNIFDPDKETFKVLREKDLPGIKGSVILPVHIDTIRQKAWLFATGSIDQYWDMDMYEMDMKTRKCWPITFRDSSKRIDPWGISPNEVTPYKDGLLVCDEAHGIYEIKKSSLFADLIIPFSSGIGRVVLEEDRFIFLQRGGSLPNFSYENKNGKWIRIPHPTDTLNWTAMLYNKKDQTHWVSLKYELALYDKVFRKIKSYGEQDGFNGPALNMLTDHVGNLWFTNLLNQIGRLDPATGIITTLSEADGFKRQTFGWWDSRGKDTRGNLYFGGNGVSMESKGLDRIHPERYSSAKTSFVYLRSLEINQKPFPLSIGINNLEELSLDYDQNTLNIETGIIDYYAMGKGHIRYKLEESGSNADWQYSPANYTIRYEGLPPGAYRLVMQTSNAGNEFNSPEKILMINIGAPFWETWWFRTLAGFSFLAILYAIIHFRSLSLKRQNVQLEEKVIVRTKELNQSLEELKSTQAQLIQSEKMASLGELTAGIAHEIQNPLNFVNNFSDLNTELVAELKDEINNGNFEEVKAIAKDIADNEEKINHHGKRADAIVKGMLQHSRSSSGKKEPTDINALVDEYLRLAYHGLRAKDKSFNATMSTDFDKTIKNVNIIPQDIGRAILNLITNAFYAVSEKEKLKMNGYKPTVTVSTKAIHDKVEIKVKDNGSGIPQKVLDKIFQPFFTTKPTGQGTGLGLSLSYDIIKAHGGEIDVKTKEGEYSEFIIQLPGKQDSQITIR